MPRSKADWSRPLAEPIKIGRRRLRTLHDVRAHILALPADRQAKQGWQVVAGSLLEASQGGELDRVEMSVRLARMLDPEVA